MSISTSMLTFPTTTASTTTVTHPNQPQIASSWSQDQAESLQNSFDIIQAAIDLVDENDFLDFPENDDFMSPSSS